MRDHRELQPATARRESRDIDRASGTTDQAGHCQYREYGS
jgi:hypothetical protein